MSVTLPSFSPKGVEICRLQGESSNNQLISSLSIFKLDQTSIERSRLFSGKKYIFRVCSKKELLPVLFRIDLLFDKKKVPLNFVYQKKGVSSFSFKVVDLVQNFGPFGFSGQMQDVSIQFKVSIDLKDRRFSILSNNFHVKSVINLTNLQLGKNLRGVKGKEKKIKQRKV